MEVLFSVFGVIIGVLVAKTLDKRKTGYGLFSIEAGDDPDDPETVNLRVKIFANQDLRNKKQILLYRDSHK